MDSLNLKRADKAIGVKQATKIIERDSAGKVYLAHDAEPRVTNSLRAMCVAKNLPLDDSMTMIELGRACGIEVGAAAVAVKNKGND